ncbi:MAG TPA: aldehyde dehydrogenase family protein [Xanthobacteraceae bacterium]|nr:aldehyde dehydrogenase family protein [Xanthobacteraceae bacterium]
MKNALKFYIDGTWVDPVVPATRQVINPATEESAGTISMGSAADVDRAAAAARRAFADFGRTTRAERISLLQSVIASYRKRADDIAEAIILEIGSPRTFSVNVQAKVGLDHFEEAIRVLETYPFESTLRDTVIRREPIGVCGLITPWNWPVNQIVAKLASALAAGCTSVLKPSELSPLSALILAEVLHDAGVPKGVFNLVNGDGPTVGQAIASHPEIDLVSFTGSTRAGILVAQAAAPTVKRVSQELGGKSATIILPDADLDQAVVGGVLRCYTNAGQSCQAPSRMLVHESQLGQVVQIARAAAQGMKVGDPQSPETTLGPVASRMQYDKVQGMIESGLREGATLVCGGPDRPAGLNRGYFVQPTVFSDVRPDMTIAREEIFGPVLSILSYRTEDEAVDIANDTVYGLAGYVQSGSPDKARDIAARLRAGRIYINGALSNSAAPFGGYKQSGNGRELGVFGLEEYLEVKAILES